MPLVPNEAYEACPVAAVRVWNEPPRHVTSASSLRVFWQSSEDSPFSAVAFPTFCSACEVTCVIFGHCNRFCCLLLLTNPKRPDYLVVGDHTTLRISGAVFLARSVVHRSFVSL